jgi:hypothetical protein
MPKSSFEKIWERIIANADKTFHTITGLPFTYKTKGNTVYPSRTEYQISKSDFEKAYEMVPIKGPGVISNIVRGPTYVWAILHDRRISLDEW